MSTTESRRGVLDEALDRADVGPGFPAELFSVVDALGTSVALRRAITDPGTPEGARSGLAHGLFDSRVSAPVAGLVADAAVLRWNGGRTFVDSLERQGVRALLRTAEADGNLDEVEDELFRFARLVESSPDLRNAFSDRSRPIGVRQDLVGDLLEGRASPATVTLAKRAVVARERTFAHTIEGYLDLAAAQRNQVIATVRVAQPLATEQRSRLQAALARQVGRDVVLQEVIDPDVIGGVQVELGDEVVEGTVAARLEEARRLFG